ncbi:hypothetical protein BH23VER1_BH23VER1_11970 [soil metagenome]
MDIHYTAYTGRSRHGYMEEKHWSFWITVEGMERLRLGCCGPFYLDGVLRNDLTRRQGWELAKRDGVEMFGPDEAVAGLKEFLNLGIDGARQSRNPIIRGLALADARFGARRLRRIEDEALTHDVERLFFRVRIEGSGAGRSHGVP